MNKRNRIVTSASDISRRSCSSSSSPFFPNSFSIVIQIASHFLCTPFITPQPLPIHTCDAAYVNWTVNSGKTVNSILKWYLMIVQCSCQQLILFTTVDFLWNYQIAQIDWSKVVVVHQINEMLEIFGEDKNKKKRFWKHFWSYLANKIVS